MEPKKGFFALPFVIPSLVLGVALLGSAGLVSQTLYSIRALDNTLSTTGSAKQKVTADTVKWSINVTRSTYESGIPSAYTQVGRDMDAVKAYLLKQGVTGEQIRSAPIFVDQDYSYSSDPNAPKRYVVRQMVTVESSDVQKVKSISESIGALVSQGIIISPQMPEYFISTLPNLRVSLLGAALEDAKARAGEIAKSAGNSVGKLKSAASGVVQVLQPNSIDVADYGAYDTSTIDKEVMVTVRATFLVN